MSAGVPGVEPAAWIVARNRLARAERHVRLAVGYLRACGYDRFEAPAAAVARWARVAEAELGALELERELPGWSA